MDTSIDHRTSFEAKAEADNVGTKRSSYLSATFDISTPADSSDVVDTPAIAAAKSDESASIRRKSGDQLDKKSVGDDYEMVDEDIVYI